MNAVTAAFAAPYTSFDCRPRSPATDEIDGDNPVALGLEAIRQVRAKGHDRESVGGKLLHQQVGRGLARRLIRQRSVGNQCAVHATQLRSGSIQHVREVIQVAGVEHIRVRQVRTA